LQEQGPYANPYRRRSDSGLSQRLAALREEDERNLPGQQNRQNQADLLRLGGAAGSVIPYVGPTIAGVAGQLADMRTREDQRKAKEDAERQRQLEFFLRLARR
jgi:hypothetical protein